MNYIFRSANKFDIDTIVDFTINEAYESQNTYIDLNMVIKGVSSAFESNPKSKYWVIEDMEGNVIASTSVTTEFSDFYGKEYWWIQSFYITQNNRGKNLSSFIISNLENEAKLQDVLELRLYVHHLNQRAINAYVKNQFTPSQYIMMHKSIS